MRTHEYGFIYLLEHKVTLERRYLHDIVSLMPPRVDVVSSKIYALMVLNDKLADDTYLFLANCLPNFTVSKKLVDIETIKRDNNVFLSLPGGIDISCIDIN